MDVSVVLVEPNNSGNVGAVARAMANFGFKKLVIVNPRCKLDGEARNRAKHAQDVLKGAKVRKTLKIAVRNASLVVGTTGVPCTDYNIYRSPLLLKDAASRLAGKKGKIAVVFGREDYGLYNDEIETCDFMITIPTDKRYPIMNISHAVSVVLYELSCAGLERNISDAHPLADPKDIMRLLKLMNKTIDSVKFKAPSQKETQRMVWRRVLGKGMITKREAYAMMGFLKKLKKSR